MTSKIKVDNIENQCGGAVVTKCGGTTTISGSVVKSNAIQASDGGNLVSQCGTTITLGASGDTINLASGASQSGFGRTGTVDWDTTPKTATFSAVSGNGYFCNTTAGAFTVNLPAGSAGAIVSLADYAATWQTNSLTVSPNGTDKIGSQNLTAILSTQGQSVTFVYVDSTQGWINTMDSTSNVRGASFIAATGGTITTIGDYKIHAFTGPGTFCVTNVGDISNLLVVAGGGSGARADIGAGGGAGGLRNLSTLPVTVQGYPITVGAGGAAVFPLAQGNDGSNSVAISYTSTGGGGGGGGAPPYGPEPGNPGGSGGGGGNACGTGGTGNTPPVSPAQGFDGGPGAFTGPTGGVGGGGGGATAAGSGAPTAPLGGAGGAGLDVSPFFGTAPQPFYQANQPLRGNTICGQFAGGGGGAGDGPGGATGGEGGVGGGGKGSSPGNPYGQAGTTNSGGGGGAGENTRCGSSGAGGSGIVIIRYKFQ